MRVVDSSCVHGILLGRIHEVASAEFISVFIISAALPELEICDLEEGIFE